MPFIKDESKEKRDSAYLKYESENTLLIYSNLYKIPFHYLSNVKKYVKCLGEECAYCEAGFKKSAEYNYYVELNGQKGALNIKSTVFFNIQGIANAKKQEQRHIQWLVLKKGEGLETEYTVSKDENLSKEYIQAISNALENNNAKLDLLMVAKEKQLEDNYHQYLDQTQGKQVENTEETEEAE